MSQFEVVMRDCLKDFTIGDKGQFCGFCASEEEIEDILTKLKCIGYSYSVRSSAHRHPSSNDTSGKPRFFFTNLRGNVVIPFFGSAFSVENLSNRQCTLGPNYYEKYEDAVPYHLADHIIPYKKPKSMYTKKSDCPATFFVKCIRVYPGYSIQSVNDREIKKRVIDSLKQNLELPNKPESFLRFYVVASPPDHHTHSAESMKANGDLHPLLGVEIINHVKNGTSSIRDIRLLLEKFVETTFTSPGRPDRANTMFYPRDQVIYSHVYRALGKMRKRVINDIQDTSSNDETNNEHKLPEASSSCSFLYENARDICKNIINLTYSCNNDTIKKLVDDLKNVQRSVELSNPTNSLPYAVASNTKI